MNEEILITKDSYDKLAAELEDLKKVKLPAIVKRIEEAIKLGDLSENAEYHQAKEDQGWAAARIRELESKLEKAKIIEKSAGKTVSIGSRLVIVAEDGKEKEIEIVDQVSSDPLSGKISNESPMGRVMMGRKVGDQVTVELPVGKKIYTIKELN